MNTLLFQISSYSASIILKSSRSFVGTSLFYGNCFYSSNLSWKRSIINYPSVKNSINLGTLSSSIFSRFVIIQCYSTKKKSPRKRKSSLEPAMEEEKEAFFVVRKGDVVGVYKSLSECQAQVGSSISDPPVSVYKGYSLPKDAEEYLASRGLQNALYTIKASDMKDDLLGMLVPCPFQEPSSSRGETSATDLPQKRPHDELGSGNVGVVDPLSKLQKLDHVPSDSRSCILHFDGASKGNPGLAGAGAVLQTLDGSLICKVRQGLGTATNNVAEYRAVILGLEKALEKGYTSIQAIGDSKLVCMQLQGLWRVRHPDMFVLHAEAQKLKDQFSSFQIAHVLRDGNSDVDEEANLAIGLADGQIQEVFS